MTVLRAELASSEKFWFSVKTNVSCLPDLGLAHCPLAFSFPSCKAAAETKSAILRLEGLTSFPLNFLCHFLVSSSQLFSFTNSMSLLNIQVFRIFKKLPDVLITDAPTPFSLTLSFTYSFSHLFLF